MSGTIPDALGNLTNLVTLTLNYGGRYGYFGPGFQGTLPASLNSLTKLTSLCAAPARARYCRPRPPSHAKRSACAC